MKKGFTLIELLIVIAIIGILAVAFIPSLLGAPSKARDTRRMADVKKIADLFTLQYAVSGAVPAGPSCIVPGEPIGVKITENLASLSGVFPKDPDPNNCFGATCCAAGTKGSYWFIDYSNSANPYKFAIFANVENNDNGNLDALPAANDANVNLLDAGDYYAILVQR